MFSVARKSAFEIPEEFIFIPPRIDAAEEEGIRVGAYWPRSRCNRGRVSRLLRHCEGPVIPLWFKGGVGI